VQGIATGAPPFDDDARTEAPPAPGRACALGGCNATLVNATMVIAAAAAAIMVKRLGNNFPWDTMHLRIHL
jgi:hypothetical protein